MTRQEKVAVIKTKQKNNGQNMKKEDLQKGGGEKKSYPVYFFSCRVAHREVTSSFGGGFNVETKYGMFFH